MVIFLRLPMFGAARLIASTFARAKGASLHALDFAFSNARPPVPCPASKDIVLALRPDCNPAGHAHAPQRLLPGSRQWTIEQRTAERRAIFKELHRDGLARLIVHLPDDPSDHFFALRSPRRRHQARLLRRFEDEPGTTTTRHGPLARIGQIADYAPGTRQTRGEGRRSQCRRRRQRRATRRRSKLAASQNISVR